MAHTLSEHFFDDHHFAQSSEDSDLSEFETEPDHRNDFALSYQFSDENSGCNLNNNNNIEDNCDTLKKIEDLIRGAFHSRKSEPPGYAESISSGYSRIMDQPTDNAVDAQEFHAYSVLDTIEMPFKDTEENHTEKSNTPDILRKTISRNEVAPPDILQNVITESEENDAENPDDWIYIGKDGSLMEEVGDIVGDFEQEVQHELGLIVSGYSTASSTKYVLNSDVLQVQQETLACLISNANKMERLLEKVSACIFLLKQCIYAFKSVKYLLCLHSPTVE